MKKTLKIVLVLGPLFAIFLFAYFRSNWVEKELRKNGKITIARLDSIKDYPKRSYLGLEYYVGNKKVVFFESSYETGISAKDIGKFYEIKYLPDSPKVFRGNYSKEITDTTAILRAGFSREEIEPIK